MWLYFVGSYWLHNKCSFLCLQVDTSSFLLFSSLNKITNWAVEVQAQSGQLFTNLLTTPGKDSSCTLSLPLLISSFPMIDDEQSNVPPYSAHPTRFPLTTCTLVWELLLLWPPFAHSMTHNWGFWAFVPTSAKHI